MSQEQGTRYYLRDKVPPSSQAHPRRSERLPNERWRRQLY